MKFTVEQIEYIEKVLENLEISNEIILKVTEHISIKEKNEQKSINTETCMATTKAGKRCSKKPSTGENKCSIHLKNKTTIKQIKKEENVEESSVVNLTQEQKKMEIELLFGDE